MAAAARGRGPELMLAMSLLALALSAALWVGFALVAAHRHSGDGLELVDVPAVAEDDTLHPPLRRTDVLNRDGYFNGDRPVDGPDLIGERIARAEAGGS